MQFQFKVMPFGLSHTPSTFERLMDAVLEGLLGEGCLVYLDNIVAFGRTFSECRDRLGRVLQRLGEAGLKVKPSKCQLFKQEVAILGQVVSGQGIATDLDKFRVVREWPPPTCVEEVQISKGSALTIGVSFRDLQQPATPSLS